MPPAVTFDDGVGQAEPDEALLGRADADRELVRRPEDAEAVEQLDDRADAHRLEQLQWPPRCRAGRPCGSRSAATDSGKGRPGSSTMTRRRIVTNMIPRMPPRIISAAESRYSSHHVRRVEVPELEDDERRDREDRAGGHRLADRADGSGEVLLEHAALEQAQHGHADDGGRVGGRDGHAGPQPEVGVGGAEDDAHHEAEHERPERELAHRRVRQARAA